MRTPYLIPVMLLSLFTWLPVQATVWTITTPGLNFSPAVVTITLGDTVMFNISTAHNAVEVSQSTWNANGTVPNGGFSLPFGGGMVIPTQVKTYYYVCQPHASAGMKGQIIVTPSTGIPPVDVADKLFYFTPNPAQLKTTIHTGINDRVNNELKMFDITGKLVLTITNVRNNYQVDVERFKNGIYFMEITADGYRRTTKLVIEN